MRKKTGSNKMILCIAVVFLLVLGAYQSPSALDVDTAAGYNQSGYDTPVAIYYDAAYRTWLKGSILPACITPQKGPGKTA